MNTSLKKQFLFTFLGIFVLAASSFVVLRMPTHISNIRVCEYDMNYSCEESQMNFSPSQKAIYATIDVFDAVEGEEVVFSWMHKPFEAGLERKEFYTITLPLNEYVGKDKVDVRCKLEPDTDRNWLEGSYEVKATLKNSGKNISTIFTVR